MKRLLLVLLITAAVPAFAQQQGSVNLGRATPLRIRIYDTNTYENGAVVHRESDHPLFALADSQESKPVVEISAEAWRAVYTTDAREADCETRYYSDGSYSHYDGCNTTTCTLGGACSSTLMHCGGVRCKAQVTFKSDPPSMSTLEFKPATAYVDERNSGMYYTDTQICTVINGETTACKPRNPVPVWKRTLLHSACLATSLYDYGSTRYIMARGGREMNPVMRPIVTRPHLFLSIKVAIPVWSIIESEREYRRGKRLWWAGVAGCTAINGFAGGWNTRQLLVHSSPEDRKAAH